MINHGYTPDEYRGLLQNVSKAMSYHMMGRLCHTFRCVPNDLFTWEGDPTSHLMVLKRPPVMSIEKLLEGKTPQQIEEILRKIERGM